jgi:hypothetical protein
LATAPHDPLVSILLPVRNGAPWLRRACTTALDNEVPCELVAVDDGSTDDSHAQLQALAATDPRLRPIKQPAQGHVVALNRALALARAPLVARMDADDESLPGRLDAQVRRWLELGEPAGAVIGCGVEPFADGKAIGGGMARYCDWLNGLRSAEDHWRERLVESPLCHPTALLPTSLLRSVGGWLDGPFPEDYDLWLRLLAGGARIHKIAPVLYRWRDHPGRLTRVDGRYTAAAFAARKRDHMLATWLDHGAIAQVQICGAGRDAKRWCDLLQEVGVQVVRAFDLHPGRIGARIRGHVPVVDHRELSRWRGVPTLVAIGRAGGRQEVRVELTALGMVEARDFLCVQ